MADPYLTLNQALDRLDAFGIAASTADLVTDADLRLASDDLDAMAPFSGTRPEDQERQFPRVDPETGEADADGVPEGILDWVALRAASLASNEAPAVKSEGAGRVSVTYADPKPGPIARRLSSILKPYLLRRGGTGEVARCYPVRAGKYPTRGV